MTYTRDPAKLRSLIDRALSSEEITIGADKSGLPTDFLRRQALKSADAYWDAAAAEIEDYERAENEIYDSKRLLMTEVPLDKRSPKARRLTWIIAGALILVVACYSAIPWLALDTIQFEFFLDTYFLIFIGLSIVTLLAILRWKKGIQSRYYRKVRDYVQSRARHLSLAQSKSNLDVTSLRVERAVINKAILPELRRIINSSLEPSFATHISSSLAAMEAALDPTFEIQTAARKRLLAEISQMKNGSIGIAGPRGVGKSTLLLSISKGVGSQSVDPHRPLLGVVVSAPVQYDARDFILNLFSTLCRRILRRAPGPKRETLAHYPEPSPFTRETLRAIIQLSPYCFAIGALFFVLGAFAIAPHYINITSGAPSNPGNENASSQQQDLTPTSTQTERVFVRFMHSVGLKPIDFFRWSVLSLLVGTLLARVKFALNTIEESQKSTQPTEQPEPLQQEAAFVLKEIRFQQSFSSGWSGTLTFPFGLKAGANVVNQLSERQLSLPDIVNRFLEFLSLLAERYFIVIGIDELDKIESDDVALKFLNDIRSILDSPNCLFIISISESAIASFEKRGLPFRDALDSTLDSVVYVDYLKLPETTALINRRIVGLPVPFIWLCHVLAGGLPRELIRTCRNLLRHAAAQDGNAGIATLTKIIVQEDLSSRLRSLSQSAHKTGAHPDLDALIHQLEYAAISPASPHGLLLLFSRIRSYLANTEIQQINAGHIDVDITFHKTLCAVSVLVYFSITVLELFSNIIGSANDEHIATRDHMEFLARSRQAITVNSTLAISLISTVRELVGLQIPEGLTHPNVDLANIYLSERDL